MARVSSYGVSIFAALILATCCFAQTDVYRVQYFRNANSGIPDGPSVPDQLVDIVDPGQNWPATKRDPNICANIYVVAPDEQLEECCSCELSADQLLELSVDYELANNAAHGPSYLTNGAIKIISSSVPASGTCDPRNVTPAPSLREWITHVNVIVPYTFETTEAEFLPAGLSAGELHFLTNTCATIFANDSGYGQCLCQLPMTEAK